MEELLERALGAKRGRQQDALGTVVESLAELNKDLLRVQEIVHNDQAKQELKNPTRPAEKRKHPFGSAAELTEYDEAMQKFLDAQHELITHTSKLKRLRSLFGARQAARKRETSGHCEHCQGEDAPCSCTKGCERRDDGASKCHPHHCKHCKGAEACCGCHEGCARPDTIKCYPRHCGHCAGRPSMCSCTKGCVRKDGVRCPVDD